jgi:hypothetical protein
MPLPSLRRGNLSPRLPQHYVGSWPIGEGAALTESSSMRCVGAQNGLLEPREASDSNVVGLLFAAQCHAGSFGGERLLAAAEHAARLSRQNVWSLFASDSAGERIVGTATLVGDCHVVDTSRRQDGVSVLLVAGVIAGPFALARAASIARSQGALEVHCAYLGGWVGHIPGCDTTTFLSEERLLHRLAP